MSLMVAPLLEEMTSAWQQDRRLLVEDLLPRHPELAANPDVVVRLIYEEICLLEESGQQGASAEALRRYPAYRPQLEMLLECHQLLKVEQTTFPEVGEPLGPFRLLAELGRGARGRVFLGAEPALADRLLVLKVTPLDPALAREAASTTHSQQGAANGEHLSLARLQHAAIVPLYLVQQFPERGLQVLCMPYLGGLTLADLLHQLRDRPVESRSGQDLLDRLDRARASAPAASPGRGVVARATIAAASFADVVCRLGASLADALHHAHERGRVHLDIKPANVLLAADGQPMLLDFHLAQEPLSPARTVPSWVGGTPGYMPPEQVAALERVGLGRPVAHRVDGRADIFALGVVLYEALGGTLPLPAKPITVLRRNPQVSAGLADIVTRCLAQNPDHRYGSAAALAADLRRHVQHLPLEGVANRSWLERWRKWRRRRPRALALFGVTLVALLAFAAGAWFGFSILNDRHQDALADLREGRRLLHERRHEEAVRTLSRGVERIRSVPWQTALTGSLNEEMQRAARGVLADKLHCTTERLRYCYGQLAVPQSELKQLATEGGRLWEDRARLADHEGPVLDAALEQRLRSDLLDLAILWSDLRVRLAAPLQAGATRSAALRALDEAEAMFGPSPILDRERQAHGKTSPARPPTTAWEHYALGRALLHEGNLNEAMTELGLALELEPASFWSNYYQGICCSRLHRLPEALNFFTICVVLEPNSAEVYLIRAITHAAMNHPELALRDYSRALEKNPNLGEVFLNRGLLHYRASRFSDAGRDFEEAIRLKVEPIAAHFNLALVRLAQNNEAAALPLLEEVLRLQPRHAEAGELVRQLRLRGG
jgi:serine/threonine protein kinase/tetratricopeptide (TPR) repeat protein